MYIHFWPLRVPISGNVTISTPAHISLRVSSYHISISIIRNEEVELTRKNIQVSNYKKYYDFLRVKPLWPLWDPISRNVTLYTPTHIPLVV